MTPSAVTNRSKSLNVWHASSIRLILTNVHYCGDLVQHQSEIVSVTSHKRKSIPKEDQLILTDTHEAIVSKDIFKQVQEHLAKRTRTATAPQKHLFTNMLFCEECERGMWFRKNQKGYRCGGNIKYGDTFCSNRNIVRESELSNTILTDFDNLFNNLKEDSFFNSLLARINSLRQRIKNVKHDLQKLQSKKLNYVDLYTDRIISAEELHEFRKMTDGKINKLQVELAQLEYQLNTCDDENYVLNLKNSLKDVIKMNEITPKVLNVLVNRITCNIRGEVTIQYNFSDPLL
ncbi:recombinase family protein [Gottfriedia sp. NPDC057948]|uniref:recombinase family protein n=1 Tax=Gottfriedia sp. NPDC057948 TaxID=3346287 RepID=UPI0036DBC287